MSTEKEKPAPFCAEEITDVYMAYRDGNMFFDCYYDMALHLTSGFRMILETEHCYLFLQSDGVSVTPKNGPVDTVWQAGEVIDPCRSTFDGLTCMDYEYTLFCGERLLAVTKKEKYHELTFDDFVLKIVPHDVNDPLCGFCARGDRRVLGAERLIKRKCSCGGTAQLWIDDLDYAVECRDCRKSTYAFIDACDAIDSWNDGRELITCGESAEESFMAHAGGSVSLIACERETEYYDDDLVDCNCIIVETGGRKYEIVSSFAGTDTGDPTEAKCDFSISEVSAYNREFYPRRIVSTEQEPILFIRREDDESFPALLFMIGNRPLRVTADHGVLTVGLSSYDADGNTVYFKNRKMFNA